VPSEDRDVEALAAQLLAEGPGLAQAHELRADPLRIEVAEDVREEHLGPAHEGGVEDQAESRRSLARGHGRSAQTGKHACGAYRGVVHGPI
jgi:hypothetical protein